MTHALIGMLPCRLNRVSTNSHKVFFFLAGNLMPDLISRVPMILFPKQSIYFTSYHTLIGTLIMSYVLSFLFSTDYRKNIFKYLFSGAVFHLITDLIQKDIFNNGYDILFPLNLKIKLGFIWPEDSLYALPFLLILVFILYHKSLIKLINKN